MAGIRIVCFTLSMGVLGLGNESYKVGISDPAWGAKAVHDCGLEDRAGEGFWALVVDVASYEKLHGLAQRAGLLVRLLAGEAADEFADEASQLSLTTEVERLTVQRVGQDIFRRALIDYWQGRCAVTGLDLVPLLRASHIKLWAKCDSDSERLDLFKGLLLAPHLDDLFDDGWISFADDGALLLSSELTAEQSVLLGIHPDWKLATLADQHHDYLDYHRQVVFLS
jgi:putative restriction endonuclease